ncbi:MAG: hypothetical protein KKD94_06455 [Nanoarchaeota archaeon]|nr:hypothetical protein [Nanoarchaeota archaeon]
MKLSFELLGGKLKEVSETFLILSNIKRLKLLLLLNKLPPSSSADVHKAAKKEGIYDNRETTYRALEDLVKIKLVSKTYDEEKKELVYKKNENHS